MRTYNRLIQLLRLTDPKLEIESDWIWDVIPAQRGLSVLLRNGTFVPIVLPPGTAKQILHSIAIGLEQSAK